MGASKDHCERAEGKAHGAQDARQIETTEAHPRAALHEPKPRSRFFEAQPFIAEIVGP